jgi:muconate cycloisomerase
MVKKLFKEIRPDNIELLEQPFKRNAWQAVESLAKWSPVPIMLDESIWIADDIKKASECRAGFVKLKLMKHGGIRNTVKLAKLAQGLGLKVILGNGVQTDLGCLDECYAYKFANLKLAGEMNGFLKLKHPLLSSGIYQKNGIVIADLKKVVGNTEEPNIKKRHILKKISLKMRGQI